MTRGIQKASEALRELVSSHPKRSGELIPVLQHVQERFGYISETATEIIAEHLRISSSEVYGVASFYAQFRFEKPARHSIKVCLGTACHVRGGQEIVDALATELGIEPGEITQDHRFGLETVNCVGACALGPLMIIDEEYFGQMTPDGSTRELKRRIKRK
jgi:NADH-quinone oxidoreductase subunit E